MMPKKYLAFEEDYHFLDDAVFFEWNSSEDTPVEVMTRILRGEHPVRVFRQFRRLSVAELATRAGLNVRQLMQIENGRKDAPRPLLARIARALKVDLAEIA